MKKIVRYSLKGLLWILGIIVLIWIGLLVYVTFNEDKLIGKIASVINQRTKGETRIKGLSVSLLRTFPILSLQLKDVVLMDSLYPVHHKELLTASDIYLKVSLSALIHGEPALGKVILRNGSINLIVDSSGSGNGYVFKSDNSQPKAKDRPSVSPDIHLSNIVFTYVNEGKHKLYQAAIRDLNCSVSDDNARAVLKVDLNMQIRHLEFNTARGSFARDKPVKGKLRLVFDKATKNIIADNVHLNIADHAYVFNGAFSVAKENPTFNLKINTRKIGYDNGIALLSDVIQKKLKKYSMSKPLDLRVELSGLTVYKSEPRVEIWADVAHSDIKAPQGSFKDCSFHGYFTNEMVKGRPLVDSNSIIQLEDFSATWEKIFFKSKSAKIYNFEAPVLECDIRSEVDTKTINHLSGSTTLQFQKGKTNVDIKYKGPVDADKMSIPDIDGEIRITGAEMKYLPRNFLFSNLEGILIFKDHDLTVKKLGASIGATKLEMSGYAKSFLSMLIVSPEKLETRWKIQSPEIKLDDFTAFLSKSKTSSEKKTPKEKAEFAQAAARVDKMFEEGEVFISLVSPSMTYKNFRATNVQGEVILKKGSLELQKSSFKHAKGSMDISGSLTNGDGINPITLHTQMNNMDIPLLFKAFDNFGQDAITHKNLSGTLSAEVNLTSAISDKAKMVTANSKGTIEFLLQNGELNHFEPIMKVGEKVFKKQNFQEIKFADLKNKLDLTGTTFIINPMEIRSTAMTLFVEGIYDVKKGSDMSIQLPLKNLTKSQANTDLDTDVKKKKGVSLRLRARTGDDGKLKLTWDPFRRSIQNKEDIRNSTGKGANKKL